MEIGLLRDLCWVRDKIMQREQLEEDWSSASLTNVLQACSLLQYESSFQELTLVALEKVAHGGYSLSNAEYLTILSCLVRLDASSMKSSALCSMEAALGTTESRHGLIETCTRINLERGLGGFRPRDWGHLSWACTELQCSPEIAELIFGHAFSAIGIENLDTSSVCLLSRMISIRGDHRNAKQNLETIIDSLENDKVLHRMSHLRDSTMMLLSISRLTKSACENDEYTGNSISSGLKWTLSVVAYRKSRGSMNRIVDALCCFIVRAVKEGRGNADHSVYSGILYSLALLQYNPKDIMQMCLRGLDQNIDALTLRTIATCSWSLSVLRYEDVDIMQALATRVIEGKLIKDYASRDLSQAISMILYSFSVLNVFEEHRAFDTFLEEIMNAAESCMSLMAPETLPIFGWSIVVSHSKSNLIGKDVFKKAMRRWRSEVADHATEIPKATLALVHHTEIALGLESPSLGLERNASFESSINFMYSSGRVKRYAMREWNTQQSMPSGTQNSHIVLDGISLFQKQVFEAAERVYSGWSIEYWDEKLQYPVDMALPLQKIVIEADGPTHFTCNTNKPLGATALKRRLLRKLGWSLVVVPYYEWNIHGTTEEQYIYMENKLKHFLNQIHDNDHSPSKREKRQEKQDHPVVPAMHDGEEIVKPNRTIQENASRLDIINTAKGTMPLNKAMKRNILRNVRKK